MSPLPCASWMALAMAARTPRTVKATNAHLNTGAMSWRALNVEAYSEACSPTAEATERIAALPGSVRDTATFAAREDGAGSGSVETTGAGAEGKDIRVATTWTSPTRRVQPLPK